MPIEALRASLLIAALAGTLGSAAAAPPALTIDVEGRSEILFEVAKKPCPGFTMPDIHARAFRTADGNTTMFALDQSNPRFVGKTLSTLSLDCPSALTSGENADPAVFDGRRYIGSTWTNDGIHVAALVHDEYHAETHPGRCTSSDGLACWYNTLIAVRSEDGGAHFMPASPLVVAAAPFRQDVGQVRHRGFFNPSNMFAGPDGVYVFTSTTGWDGQEPGACLLRNRDPLDSAGWRGWDGHAFTARWSNPYASARPVATPCKPVVPFGLPVASVVRHRPSGLYLAIWEQVKIEGPTKFGDFPVDGFYLATSRNLTEWSEPRLFLPAFNEHQACGLHEENKGGTALAYPSLLDEQAAGRNYDNVGNSAWLYVTRIAMDGCNPGARRILMRQKVTIGPYRPT